MFINGIRYSMKRAREELVHRFGFTCWVCSKNFGPDSHTALGDIYLGLHHKVYDRNNLYTWSDFMLLCRKCNSSLGRTAIREGGPIELVSSRELRG